MGFDPRGIWKCIGTKGTVFPDVDLEEGEWNDYDEKVGPQHDFLACHVQFVLCRLPFLWVFPISKVDGRRRSGVIRALVRAPVVLCNVHMQDNNLNVQRSTKQL